MYASERDGDYYYCACDETKYHSYLVSERGGTVMECCRKKGWDTKSVGIGSYVKKPSETWEEVFENSRRYRTWVSETDWERYYTDKEYQKGRYEVFVEQVRNHKAKQGSGDNR